MIHVADIYDKLNQIQEEYLKDTVIKTIKWL